METTTTTLKDLGNAVARIQGDGIYLTGVGFFLWILVIVTVAILIFAFGALVVKRG